MALWLAGAPAAWSQALPQEVAASKVRLLDADSQVVEGTFPGLLLFPKTAPNYHDEKYHRVYRLACHVYAAAPGRNGGEIVYRRRFLVCAADRDALAFTRKVARLLLLLYGERHERIRDDHAGDRPTVNVWLTERVEPGLSPDTGGEQFENQIYLYNIHRERADIEWAREIAHEYGHYALPGISGFKSPEEWANGVLGERLFLKWLRDDLQAARIKASDLDFVDAAMLNNYYTRAIWPLIARLLRFGMDPQAITGTNAAGMDYYTGFALYVDTLYGTAALVSAMQDTRSASSLTFSRATDFLVGFTTALRGENEITLNVPAFGATEREHTIHFYLPAGTWNVAMQPGVLAWQVPSDAEAGLLCTETQVTARKPGWCILKYLRARDGTAGRLTFRKRG